MSLYLLRFGEYITWHYLFCCFVFFIIIFFLIDLSEKKTIINRLGVDTTVPIRL